MKTNAIFSYSAVNLGKVFCHKQFEAYTIEELKDTNTRLGNTLEENTGGGGEQR